jgi:ribosome biogenesis GTPase / thiamine phosphate phosphatase
MPRLPTCCAPLSLAPTPLLSGEILAVHGRHYIVELASGELITCFPRGKRSLAACGDRVAVVRTAADQGVIEAVDPRRSLLYRSDQHRQKLIAANVTQMVIVLATVPSFYEELLNRCLVAAAREGIAALIVMNKLDLATAQDTGLEVLELYRNLGYSVLALSAKTDVSPLRSSLSGHLSVLVGQSGMGKSTIVNGIFPQAAARVGDVSFALDSGRHTTTHSRLYRLDERSALIDSPGLQEFGLAHLTIDEVAAGYPEFRPYLGHCRFSNCRHCDEPDCAIASAAGRADISPRRLELYRRIARELTRAAKVTRG